MKIWTFHKPMNIDVSIGIITFRTYDFWTWGKDGVVTTCSNLYVFNNKRGRTKFW